MSYLAVWRRWLTPSILLLIIQCALLNHSFMWQAHSTTTRCSPSVRDTTRRRISGSKSHRWIYQGQVHHCVASRINTFSHSEEELIRRELSIPLKSMILKRTRGKKFLLGAAIRLSGSPLTCQMLIKSQIRRSWYSEERALLRSKSSMESLSSTLSAWLSKNAEPWWTLALLWTHLSFSTIPCMLTEMIFIFTSIIFLSKGGLAYLKRLFEITNLFSKDDPLSFYHSC